MSSVDDLGNYVTKEQLTTALNGKADATHKHAIADTMGLQAALDSKATFFTRSDMDADLAQVGVATPLDYANAKTLMANAGMFYQDGEFCANVLAMAEVISALCAQIDANATTAAGKAAATHTHAIADVDGLQAALDSKANAAAVTPIANGGTGATTKDGARKNLGIATVADVAWTDL